MKSVVLMQLAKAISDTAYLTQICQQSQTSATFAVLQSKAVVLRSQDLLSSTSHMLKECDDVISVSYGVIVTDNAPDVGLSIACGLSQSLEALASSSDLLVTT